MLSNSVWNAVGPIDILQDQWVLLQTHDYAFVHTGCGQLCYLTPKEQK